MTLFRGFHHHRYLHMSTSIYQQFQADHNQQFQADHMLFSRLHFFLLLFKNNFVTNVRPY